MPALKKKRPLAPAVPGVALETVWRARVDDWVQAMAWSPDRRALAVAAVSGPIAVFDARDGSRLRDLSGHGFGTTSLAWGLGGLLASAGQDGLVRIWHALQSDAPEIELEGGARWVEHVAWSADGQLLATSAGRSLRLWTVSGGLIHEFTDHSSTISDIAWKPRSHVLASASYARVSLWDADKKAPVGCYEWKGSSLVLAWSPDAKYLATGDQDSTVHFWITATGKDLQMYGYPTKVRELSWDKHGRFLATGGSSDVTVWDCHGKGPEGTTPISYRSHQDNVSCLAFEPDGPLLASGGQDGLLALWQPPAGKRSVPLAQVEFGRGITHALWTETRLLAVGTEGGAVSVFEVA